MGKTLFYLFSFLNSLITLFDFLVLKVLALLILSVFFTAQKLGF